MLLFSLGIHQRGPFAACSFVVACLILDLGFAGYPSQALAQEQDRIADLEAELERARDAGNDAEVEEINGLLRRLRAGSHSGDLPKPAFVIRCGPRSDEVFHRTEESDLAVLPDRRSRRSTDYGHVGGEGYRRWFHLIWGRPDAHLYAQGRVALRSYRLPLPCGEY